MFSKVNSLRKERLGDCSQEETCVKFSQVKENVKIVLVDIKQIPKSSKLQNSTGTTLHVHFTAPVPRGFITKTREMVLNDYQTAENKKKNRSQAWLDDKIICEIL